MSLLSPQLQAFLAIVKHKTVHAAATSIHLTQTAVTQRIRTLEMRIGATLFIRTRRGMILSPDGEVLLRYCYTVQGLEGEALAQIKGAGITSDIQMCITGPTSIMRSRIIPQCILVMKQFPHLLMHYDINDVENRIKSLRSGETQFAVIKPEDVAPEMSSKLLQPERYVLVCSSAWKKRKTRDIIKTERIVDYNPVDQMTYHYLKHFGLFDLARHDRHFVNRTDALAMLLTAKCGYGVLTIEFSKPYIESNQLMVMNSGKIYENNIALAWYERHEPPKYFTAIIDAIE